MPRGEVITTLAAKRFGFIRQADSADDVFFHESDSDPGVFDSLKPETLVEFEVRPSPRGPRAVNVRIVTGADT